MKRLARFVQCAAVMFVVVLCGCDKTDDYIYNPPQDSSIPSRESINVNWTEVSSPFASDEEIKKLVFLRNSIFLIGYKYSNVIYQSKVYRTDNGTVWREMNIRVDGVLVREVYDIDIDGSTIYFGTHQGLVVSYDNGRSFSWVFQWGWDEVGSVDFIDGYGWGWINSWGSFSGLFRSTSRDPVEHIRGPENHGFAKVFPDPFYPRSIVFLGHYSRYKGQITIDSGRTWTNLSSAVTYVSKLGDQTFVCSSSSYSLDRGQTWLPLRLNLEEWSPNIILYDNILFAVEEHKKGAVVGNLSGSWKTLGLSDCEINYLAVGQDKLWATSSNRLFNASLLEISQQFNAQ